MSPPVPPDPPGDKPEPEAQKDVEIDKIKADDEKPPEKASVKAEKEIEKIKADHEKPPEKLPIEKANVEKASAKEIEKIKADKEIEKIKPDKELAKPEGKELIKPEGKETKHESKEKHDKEKHEKETKHESKEKHEKEKHEKETKHESKEKLEKEKHDKHEKEKESLKPEHKEFAKEIEKQVPEKGVKEQVEAGQPGGEVVNPPLGLDPGGLLAHADSLEQTGRQLRHFIERSMRPDLSEGALKNEEDLTDGPAPGQDDA